MVHGVTIRRIVLIADAAVEGALVREIERLECTAYTSVHCAGRTARGVMDDGFSGTSHVRVEVLAEIDAIRSLAWFVHEGPLSRYSIVSFVDTVDILECAAVA